MLPPPGPGGVFPAACVGPGAWRQGKGRFATVNPATGQILAEVGNAEAPDHEEVLVAARAGFECWRGVPAPKRGELVRRIAEELRRHKDALGTLVSLETGKIKQEGDGEVQEMIDIADFAVGQSRMLHGLSLHSERPRHRMYEQWHPLGAVGVITAFNFPVAVWAWNAFIAAVAGDTVVWKPSPKTPLCALAVQELCNRAMEETGETGIFCLLLGDHTAAERIAADSRVALLSFTGSSAVGRRLAGMVAARMGRSLLECSGNNALIVDQSADLDLALPAIVFAAVGTAGQRCTTTRRLIVHESRFDEVAERLVEAYRRLRIGDPLDPATHVGPLIDAAAVSAFEQAVEELRGQGGEVLHGGTRLPRPGYFVEPALARAENHWPVVQRENFGPLLHLIRCASLEEAVALNNDVPQGLSSALFTDSLRSAELFLSAAGSDCGIANVNAGTSGAEIGGAFGGEKETGGGREAGSDAWKAYMRRQTVTINWGLGLPLAQGIRFKIGEE
ncbi:MAG TPA: aldehyde dehydrogenase family protein [Burkholderiales bacterium]